MSKHLFGLIVTHHGTAANNRGETEGNITTLQKLLWNGDVHTTVSAEAIRFALRWLWQRKKGIGALNRRWGEGAEKGTHEWADPSFANWEAFLDDDVLGFMSAEAAKEEANPAERSDGGEGTKKKRKGKARGTVRVRRARFEVTRAVSLTPFAGDITFNAASVGATPSASSTGKDPVPYGTELHATRYQYGFALTPEDLARKERVFDVIEGVTELSEVAGNQARFLFDFSPDAVLFRWTEDFAPRILYGFALDEDGRLSLPAVVGRIEAGDIAPAEVVVGGSIAGMPDGVRLRELGCEVVPGVREAARRMKERIAHDLGPAEG
ncbi:MAG: DevR family CRISPR-associated autoregulator [Deltaproteobacteria bacterium]|nr:MAG: DevR family CRISPR-associated autoregulator [Deltaproteobacteria bacterium]